MKKIFSIITLFFLLVGYIVFIHKQSEFVAGEYRHYTLYEEYQARQKFVDYSAKAYEKDIYNIRTVKNKLISETEIIDKYRIKIKSYCDSLYLISNSVPDYNRYTLNLKKLILKIDYQKAIILNFENELNELDKYISKLERDIVSIKMYKSDITNCYSFIKSIDSTANKYKSSLSFIQGIAELKSLRLEKEILESREIERQNLIVELKRKRELENQKTEYYTEYSSNNYDSDYSRYNSTKSFDLPTTYYSTPSISSYPSSFYSINTNPNHVEVNGYYKSNGTYVEPYIRTAPNSTIRDNFSTSPNLNPYTGKIGTIKY